MSVCTHEHLTDRCSALRLLQRQSCQQMVHGVFALMNICRSLFSALRFATALVMSADGSWSVCTHEHLTDRCLSALRLLQR
jgi:hypothetical protein